MKTLNTFIILSLTLLSYVGSHARSVMPPQDSLYLQMQKMQQSLDTMIIEQRRQACQIGALQNMRVPDELIWGTGAHHDLLYTISTDPLTGNRQLSYTGHVDRTPQPNIDSVAKHLKESSELVTDKIADNGDIADKDDKDDKDDNADKESGEKDTLQSSNSVESASSETVETSRRVVVEVEKTAAKVDSQDPVSAEDLKENLRLSGHEKKVDGTKSMKQTAEMAAEAKGAGV